MAAPASRPVDRAQWLAAALPAVAFALLLALAGLALWLPLSPAQREALMPLLEPGAALVLMLWVIGSIAAGSFVRSTWERHASAPGRIAEQVAALVLSDDTRTLEPADSASAGSRALLQAINGLAASRDALLSDLALRVAEASREVDQERSRLAALMAELTQSVVVCNLDGRVLLFNARARLQFRALAAAPTLGGAEVLGLGRSIYGVLDRRLVAHALEAVQQRLARGAANPSAQFVTATQSGQLLRVQLAPVREPGAAVDAPLNGFVLMLENITREMADEREREQLLLALTEGSRSSIGNLKAAVELLEDPELDTATRDRFLGVIRDEISNLAQRLNEAARTSTQALKTRWPLEDMLGSDLVAAALRRIEAEAGCKAAAAEVDASLWLTVESFSIIQALVHLAQRLAAEYDVARVQVRLQASATQAGASGPERAQLDLVFPVQAMSTETVVGWETEPLLQAGGQASSLTLRDVVERHGGAFWFERERVRQQAFFRFLLPLAGDSAPLEAVAVVRHESRPEFYDFNLFAAEGAGAAALADRALTDLSYTVFDTETTGLEPAQGDEIIQIGATRIVAGRLRRQETFDQLVDPARGLPEAGIAIHGITPDMLVGQPDIGRVLPAFHGFAADSVLVAHNAAFDMRFLQLKEEATGIRFEQPVLDTLLLSAVIHPQQESHRLEAIADRLGVTILGRHTALGDAMVTAEVFLKMLPLLEAAGIRTLDQALEASRKTYLARVSY